MYQTKNRLIRFSITVQVRKKLPTMRYSFDIFSPIQPLNIKQYIYIDRCRRWSAVTVYLNNKSILIIKLYRVPESLRISAYTSVEKYNEINRVIYTATEYQESVLINITNYIYTRDDINDLIVVGDLN